ncbi:phage major capsid protein [Bacillus sonorensis]|uniref:phage major capsid protein n=1 Tax=Bacillus sonorensis TaxID=119858 RepID=UPI0022803FFE|nr:phage major capsid protein [Bacillus sonorensis]MCY8562206.1 phage major capsid protein [Bacillus sonorensis]MEC1428900.1 phage major capsid protein [Bacillus sonorensis]
MDRLKEIQAKIEEKEKEGKELVKAKKFDEAEKVKAELDDLKNELKAEIMFMKDEESHSLATQVKLLSTASAINGGNEGNPIASFGGEQQTKKLSASKEYLNAWAKDLRGDKLNEEEREIFDRVNDEFKAAFTHTTENTGILIPDSVATGIWTQIAEDYPLWADVASTRIKGNLSYTKGTGATATMEWYDEDTETEDTELKFGELNLTGCELSRAVTLTWKLRAMAIEDLVPYVQRELATLLGQALSYAVYKGKGKPSATDTFKPEPQGIRTALAAQTDKPQFEIYTTLEYKNLTSAMAKIHSKYANGVTVYANHQTIWNSLANIVDAMGRPVFVPDANAGGVGHIFGHTIKVDATIAEGEILFANLEKGYKANVNQDISIVTEEHAKKRKVDYVGYAIVDGGVIDEKAFVVLTDEI